MRIALVINVLHCAIPVFGYLIPLVVPLERNQFNLIRPDNQLVVFIFG